MHGLDDDLRSSVLHWLSILFLDHFPDSSYPFSDAYDASDFFLATPLMFVVPPAPTPSTSPASPVALTSLAPEIAVMQDSV